MEHLDPMQEPINPQEEAPVPVQEEAPVPVQEEAPVPVQEEVPVAVQEESFDDNFFPAQEMTEPVFFGSVFHAAQPEEAKPEKPRKKRNVKKFFKGLGLSLLAIVIIAGVAAGSCFVTAQLAENYWSEQLVLLNQATDNKIAVLQQQLQDALSSEPLPVPSPDGLNPGQVYDANMAAVVSVVNVVTNGGSQSVNMGTGFFFSEDGYIITNHHVIEGGGELSVITYDDLTYPAKLIGFEASNDIAVLKVEGNGYPFVQIGSSDALSVGDQVVAIGNALGQLHSTMTVGYISAKDRVVTTDGTSIAMLQTDAAINSGNSGGPLFNTKGEVIGITTAKYSGYSNSGATIEGIGFAIPIDDVIRQIQDLKEYGYITGAYLGVTIREMDKATAQSYGLPLGLHVDEVVPGNAAARAGLQVGDIVLNVGGYDVASIAEMSRALRHFRAGDTTTITVFRSGKTLHLSITFDEKPQDYSQAEPTPEMPNEGNFDEWYEYFDKYFNKND